MFFRSCCWALSSFSELPHCPQRCRLAWELWWSCDHVQPLDDSCGRDYDDSLTMFFFRAAPRALQGQFMIMTAMIVAMHGECWTLWFPNPLHPGHLDSCWENRGHWHENENGDCSIMFSSITFAMMMVTMAWLWECPSVSWVWGGCLEWQTCSSNWPTCLLGDMNDVWNVNGVNRAAMAPAFNGQSSGRFTIWLSGRSLVLWRLFIICFPP